MRIPSIALAICLFADVLGCGGGGGSGATGPSTPATPATPVVTVSSVAVSHGGGDSLDVGGTIQLTATAKDAQGNVVSGRTVTWTTSSAATMTVTSAGLATAAGLGTATITATVDNVSGTSTIRVKQFLPYLFQAVGRVLGASDIGVPLTALGNGTADVAAAELPDGRIRIYYGIFDGGSGPGKIGSAISTDGSHFTVEAGLRHPVDAKAGAGFASPMIVSIPSGGFRLFFSGCHPAGCGMSSSTSADGLTFTYDVGLRIKSPNNDQNPACSGIVRLSDGRYRMYCSVIAATKVVGIATIETGAVFSAISTDMLTWTNEPGFLIGPGAPTLTLSAIHPTATLNSDGSVSLVYYQRQDNDPKPHEMVATSKDGRTFTTELETGLFGTEPSFLKRADGTRLLYHGGNTPGESTIYLANVTAVK